MIRRLIGLPAIVLIAALAVEAPGALAQAPAPSPCAAPPALIDGSFERPVLPGTKPTFTMVPETSVPGWDTSEPDGLIELWRSGYLGVPSADGSQFAELQANQPGELSQSIATIPGQELTYRFFHRGRDGVDTMELRIGPPGGEPNLVRTISSGKDAWREVVGRYIVPPGQPVTRFGFAAVASASTLISVGNFLDGIVFSATRCSIAVVKSLDPPSDPGRFDLLAETAVLARAAGDGAAGGPFPVPLPSVTVSERGAGGTSLDDYITTVRCADAQTGETVAESSGPRAEVSFAQPRDVVCRFANARGPAVILRKALVPGGDPGRFDLMVDGAVVAAGAGDGALSDPARVGIGPVTVSERPAGATDGSRYRSAIVCRAAGGAGAVVAAAAGRQAGFAAGPGDAVECVILNARRSADPPVPPPAPSPPPPVTPVDDGVGQRDVDLVARIEATGGRIARGGSGRFVARIANRGPRTATDVRILLPVRPRRAVPLSLAAVAPAGGGPCLVVRRAGACAIRSIGAGRSVTLALEVTAPERGARLLAGVIARAAEPERTPRDNVARASAPLAERVARAVVPVTG